MPLIEYSPNGRASCQSCHRIIQQDDVRVGSKHRIPGGDQQSYSTLYWHAGCYTNRKDFTKLYGFYKLKRDDQYHLLKTDEERKRTGLEEYAKRLRKKQCTEELKRQQRIQRRTTGFLSFLIQGLKSSPASIHVDQWIALKRADPSLDPTAIFVLTHDAGNVAVGHVERSFALELAPQLDPSKTYYAQVKELYPGGNDNQATCLIDFSKSTQMPQAQPNTSSSPVKTPSPCSKGGARATSSSGVLSCPQVVPPVSPGATSIVRHLPVTPNASIRNPYSRQAPVVRRNRPTTTTIAMPKSPVLNSPKTVSIKNPYAHQAPTTPTKSTCPLQTQPPTTLSTNIAKPRPPVLNCPTPIKNPYACQDPSTTSHFETPVKGSVDCNISSSTMATCNRVPAVTPGAQTMTHSVVVAKSKSPMLKSPTASIRNPYARHQVPSVSATPETLSSPKTQPLTTPSAITAMPKSPVIKNPYAKTKTTPSTTAAMAIQNPYSAKRSATSKDDENHEAPFDGVNFTIVGRQYYPNVTFQKEILLERDRNNQHDPQYAICVRDKITGEVGGHVPKSLAKKLSSRFDAYPMMIEGQITGPDTGLRVPARFEWPKDM